MSHRATGGGVHRANGGGIKQRRGDAMPRIVIPAVGGWNQSPAAKKRRKRRK